MSAGTQFDWSKFGAKPAAQAQPAFDWSQFGAKPAQAGSISSQVGPVPKKYLPGRGFGMEVAKGMGLDAEKIAAAEEAGGQWAGAKEIGGQVLSGVGKFIGSVAKDPFNIAQPLHGMASSVEQAIKERSPGQFLGASAAILGGAEGAEKAGPPIARGTARAAETAITAPVRVSENLGLRVPEAPKALRQAIQPGVNIPRAGESIDIAGPRLQQVRQAAGMEFKSPQDLLDGVKVAKGQIWDAIEQRMGPVKELQANTSIIASKMEQAIPQRIWRQNPQMAARLQERANTYRGNLSLKEIEDSIQSANNDLRNFYKRPAVGDSPVSAEMSVTEAEVVGLRKLLDAKVETLSGKGVAGLKLEYGALRDVERATARANAVATRQKGATLWEGLAALRAAGDLASGNILGAAKGGASLAMGNWLAKLRNPNFLIDQAFQGDKAFRAAKPIAPSSGPDIKGLLSAPPEQLGMTDVSGQPATNLPPPIAGEPYFRATGQPPGQPRVAGLLPTHTQTELSSFSGSPVKPGVYQAPPISIRGFGGKLTKGFASTIGPQFKGTKMGQISKVGSEQWAWNGTNWWRMKP